DALSQQRVVARQPECFCATEVRVESQPCPAGDLRLEALIAQLSADRGAAAALPDDSAVQRPAGAVPEQARLTLVGDANGGWHVVLARRQRLHGSVEHRAPDALGVVLDPARLGEELLEFSVTAGADDAFPVDQDGCDAGRTGIDSEDGFHRHRPSLRAAGAPA